MSLSIRTRDLHNNTFTWHRDRNGSLTVTDERGYTVLTLDSADTTALIHLLQVVFT
jgi:hypothetical protein